MIGLFCMVRKPNNFETWIKYQFSIGIDYIFLKVEDTPELEEIINKYDNIFSLFESDSNKKDNYWTLMDRQKDFYNLVIEKSISMGLKWLIHSDVDELICCKKPLRQILNDVPEEYQTVRFDNYEAIYDCDDLQNPFIETYRFKFKNLLSYGNGKSAVRVNNETSWKGPHKFIGKKLEINPQEAVILHYESPTFECWYEKFKTSSDTSIQKISEMPFQFYKDSINIIRNESKERAREYYNKMKVNNNESIVRLSWTPLFVEKNIVWSI